MKSGRRHKKRIKMKGAQLLCIFLSFLMIFITSGTAFAQAVNAAQEETTAAAQTDAASETTPTAVTSAAGASATASTETVTAADETQLRQALKIGTASIKLTSDINLTKALEISGQNIVIDLGGRVLSGQNQTQIISMTEGAGATIQNGTLRDGKTSGDGGAGVIKTSAVLKLDSVTIEGNSADGDGGALSVARGATVTMNNCRFTKNVSKGDGGAVAAEDGSNSTQNALFWTGVVGAAVSVAGICMMTFTLIRKIVQSIRERQLTSTLKKYDATVQRSDYLAAASDKLLNDFLQGTTDEFIEGYEDWLMRPLENEAETMLDSATKLAEKSGTLQQKIQMAAGSNLGRNMLIAGGVTFAAGAGTFIGANAASGWSSAKAIGKLFTGDTSGFTGSDSTQTAASGTTVSTAALTAANTPRTTSDGGKVVSNNTIFSENTANGNGGVVSLGNSGSGGAQAALLISTGDVYKNNEAAGDGGAVDSAGKVILTDAVVENNTAKDGAVNVSTEGSYDVGALTVCGTTTIRDNTTKDSNTEQSNVALDAKATIATEKLNMKSSIGVDIDDNVKNTTDSKKVAGDVQIDTTGYEADDTTQALKAAFVSDDAALTTDVYGGTENGSGDVYMGVSAPAVKIVNNWDEMQQALKDGAKIIEAGSDIKAESGDTTLNVTSQDTTINLKGHDLSAENQCGVMDISARNVTVMNGSVSGGNAEKGAGVAMEENASTALKDVTLKNNTATQNGGAVYAQTGSTVSLLGCDVTSNTAGSDGGAVALADFNTRYSAGTGATVTAANTTFTANEASGNGGVSDIGHGLSTKAGVPEVTYTSCTFTDNKAAGSGGVDNNCGAVVHTDSTATKNEAGGNGGVINKISDSENQGRTILAGTTTFTENTCGGNGGATYSNSEASSDTRTSYNGTVQITDNHTTANQTVTDNNVYLPIGAKIDMSGLTDEAVAAVIKNYSKIDAAQTTEETRKETAQTAAEQTPVPSPAAADTDLETAPETSPAAADTDSEKTAESASTAATADETQDMAIGTTAKTSGSVIGVSTEETQVSAVNSRAVATASYTNPGSIVKSDSNQYSVTQKHETTGDDAVVKTASLTLTQNVSTWEELQTNLNAIRTNDAASQTITLSADIKAPAGSSPLIVVQDNTTIDLAGHTIDGAGLTRDFILGEGLQGCTIKSGTIKGGSAESGAGIYIRKSASLNLIDMTLTGNMAEKDGGALYNEGTVNLVNCTLTGNSAADGGAEYNAQGALSVYYYCNVQNNKATAGNGGAIANDGQLQTANSTYIACTAKGAGGGIYSADKASVVLMGQMIITGNTKADGQADNLYLPKDSRLNGRLITGGSIGITAEDTARPLQITETTANDVSAYFNSDAADAHIVGKSSEAGSVVYLAQGAAETAKAAEGTSDGTQAAPTAQQQTNDEQALADSLVITCDSLIYGQAPVPAVVSNTSARAVIYQYAPAGKSSWSESVPVEPGEYQVRGVLAKDDKNAEVDSEAVAFTIIKAQPQLTGILTASPITSVQAITDSAIRGTADVAGTFSWQNTKIKGVEPGSYAFSVVFTPKDTAHYESLITQAAVVVTASAQPITADIAADGGSLTVKTAASGEAVPVSALRFYKLVKSEDAASQWVLMDNTGTYPVEDGTYLAVDAQSEPVLPAAVSFDKTGSGSPVPEPALTFTVNPAARIDMENKK